MFRGQACFCVSRVTNAYIVHANNEKGLDSENNPRAFKKHANTHTRTHIQARTRRYSRHDALTRAYTPGETMESAA